MEAQLKPQSQPFTISKEFFSPEVTPDPSCPFCDTELAQTGKTTFACENSICPYAVHEEVRDVVSALVEQGRDILQAAQIAAKYTVDYSEETDPVTPERFSVTDESSANWVLKKLAFYEARLSAYQTMIDNEIESIRSRGEQITGPITRQIEFFRAAFGDQLRAWTQEQIAGQKAKSVKLLHGSAGFRKSPERVNIIDEARAIKIAEELGLADVVRIRKEISKTNAKAALGTPEGAALADVIEIQPGEDVFYIKAELPGV